MYSQAVKNIRTIVENVNNKLKNIRKGDDLPVRREAMQQLENERKNYYAQVDSWNLYEPEKNILKNAYNRIFKDSLNGAIRSDFAIAVILDDHQFENFYKEELWQMQKLEPKL